MAGPAAWLSCPSPRLCSQKLLLPAPGSWMETALSVRAGNANSGRSAWLFPLIQGGTAAQVINPLTFGAQSSKNFGICTGKAFILAQAINTERRMDLLCRRTGEVTCISLSLSALVGTQNLVNFPSFSCSSPPRRAPGAGNEWN